MKYNTVKWIWFDVDDTIVNFTLNSRRAMEIVYGQSRLLQQLFSSTACWIENYERHNKQLWEQFNRGEIESDFLRVQRFIGPLTEAGCPENIARDTAKELDPLYLDILAAQPAIIDGADKLIEELYNRGYHIGVVSNGFSGIQQKKLKTAGVDKWIDCVVLSDDININKPDPRIFQYAMKKVGQTIPEANLMIGDNPLTDVAGALNAGWLAILFNQSSSLTDKHAKSPDSVTSLMDILNFLPEKAPISDGNA